MSKRKKGGGRQVLRAGRVLAESLTMPRSGGLTYLSAAGFCGRHHLWGQQVTQLSFPPSLFVMGKQLSTCLVRNMQPRFYLVSGRRSFR